MRFLVIAFSILLSTSAFSKEWKDLTVKEALGVYNGLNVLTQPYSSVCKEGSVEKQCQRRYSFKPTVLKTLATDMTATKAISEKYVETVNTLIKLLSNGANKVPEDKQSEFYDEHNKILKSTISEFVGIELKLGCVNFDDLKLEENPELPIGTLSDLDILTTGCLDRK